MNWTTLGPAVFSLLGVALGTIGSLLGVYYAQRAAREQARLQHRATMRTQRRDIYLEYLHAVENSWSFLDGLWGRQPLTSVDGRPLTEDEVDREVAIRNHEVWYHQQKLALVAPTMSRLVRPLSFRCSESPIPSPTPIGAPTASRSTSACAQVCPGV